MAVPGAPTLDDAKLMIEAARAGSAPSTCSPAPRGGTLGAMLAD